MQNFVVRSSKEKEIKLKSTYRTKSHFLETWLKIFNSHREERLKSFKENIADTFYLKTTFLKIKTEWLNQAYENRSTTQKIIKIRNMLNRKRISRVWDFMMLKTQSKRRKIRSVRSIVTIPNKVCYRQAVGKWQEFTLREREVAERVYNEIQKEKQIKIQKAINFRIYNLRTKAMKSWRKYMKDNLDLFIKKKAVIKRMRERRCPEAFIQWIEYTRLKQIYLSKRAKAYQFLNTAIYRKGLSALEYNKLERVHFKALFERAFLYDCGKRVQKAFGYWKIYRQNSIRLRESRQQLERVVKKVDIDSLKRFSFNMIKIFNHKTAIEHQKHTGILEKKKMQRIFDAFKNNRDHNLELKSKYNALKEATDLRMKHKFIVKWVTKYDLEWNIK